LNLWSIYFRLLNEKKFGGVDAWVWKRLAAKREGRYDSYLIASFLGLFLEVHRQFASADARQRYFRRTWADAKGKPQLMAANTIERLTRTERISTSFLDPFLRNPDQLNQNNSLVLARFYLDLGSALWSQSYTKRLLIVGEGSGSQANEQAAESYMIRAQRILSEIA
jgi:hypothetical protein